MTIGFDPHKQTQAAAVDQLGVEVAHRTPAARPAGNGRLLEWGRAPRSLASVHKVNPLAPPGASSAAWPAPQVSGLGVGGRGAKPGDIHLLVDGRRLPQCLRRG